MTKKTLILYTPDPVAAKADAVKIRSKFHTVFIRDSRKFVAGDPEKCDAIGLYEPNELIAADYPEAELIMIDDGFLSACLVAAEEAAEVAAAVNEDDEDDETDDGDDDDDGFVTDEGPDKSETFEAKGVFYALQRPGTRWFDVIAPDGSKASEKAMVMADAEREALRLNEEKAAAEAEAE